jgi:uncharacterized protein YjlB
MVRLCAVKYRRCLCHAAAIVQGESRLVLGRSKPNEGQEGTGGVEVDVSTGDVVVVPAGVSHRSLTSSGGYRYIGVYPEVSSTARYWRQGTKSRTRSAANAASSTSVEQVDYLNPDLLEHRDGHFPKRSSSQAAVADLVQTGPKWRNNFCKGEEPMEDLENEIARVEIPEADPVYGTGGPLVRIWKTAREA